MSRYRLLDLFSGIGGFSLGLERTGGFETVAFCEIDPFCRRVLAKHWPEVPCYEDVRTLSLRSLSEYGLWADAIAGGFPCTNLSLAAAVHGRRDGLDGEQSGLWSEQFRLIRELRPRVAVVENVSVLLERGFGRVLGDLASIGYDAQWDCIRACEVGAPQDRDRVWLVAYPAGERMEGLFESVRAGAARQRRESCPPDLQRFADAPFERGDGWPEPLVRGVDGRVPDWMDRIKALGNTVDPRIPELIGRAILEADTLRAAA